MDFVEKKWKLDDFKPCIRLSKMLQLQCLLISTDKVRK